MFGLIVLLIIALDSAQQEFAVQLSKGYLQFPSFRNDVRFFINYIDCNIRQGRLQEAERVARGTLALFDHLGSGAQRLKISIIQRLIHIILTNQSVLVPVHVEERIEMVRLWPEETINQIFGELKELVVNNKECDLDTVERKLLYLMSVESDTLKASEFAEASGEFPSMG